MPPSLTDLCTEDDEQQTFAASLPPQRLKTGSASKINHQLSLQLLFHVRHARKVAGSMRHPPNSFLPCSSPCSVSCPQLFVLPLPRNSTRSSRWLGYVRMQHTLTYAAVALPLLLLCVMRACSSSTYMRAPAALLHCIMSSSSSLSSPHLDHPPRGHHAHCTSYADAV
ncbi:hypothetical protein BKA81DRAFT_83334 [Phyllosticta paracitricarpa]